MPRTRAARGRTHRSSVTSSDSHGPAARRSTSSTRPSDRHPDPPGARAPAPHGRTPRDGGAARRPARALHGLDRGPRGNRGRAAALPQRRARRTHPRARGLHVAHRRHRRRRTRRSRRRRSPPAPRSKRRCTAASHSCARRDITRCATARWASASSTTSRSPRASRSASSASSASRSSTTTCITATEPMRSFATTTASSSCRCTSGRSIPGSGGPGRPGEDDAEHPARARARATTSTSRRSSSSSSRRSRRSSRSSCSSRPGSTPTPTTRSPRCSSPRTASASSRGGALRWRPACAAVLEGGYELETLPGLVAAALDGFNVLDKRKGPFGALSLPHHPPNLPEGKLA